MTDQQLTRLFEDYAGAWREGTADALAAFWNAEQFRFYKAEEIEQVFSRWEDALAYWRMNEGINDKTVIGFSEFQSAPLAEGWSSVVVRMRWDIRFAATAPAGLAGKAMGGDNHVFALLHQDRLVTWMEVPDAPVVYMRNLYEQQARGV